MTRGSIKHVEHVFTREKDTEYIGMQPGIRRHDDADLIHARREIDEEGRRVGAGHNNPILDTRNIEVEYADGEIDILVANYH